MRVWKKWGCSNEEIDINLDAISFDWPGGLLSRLRAPVAVPLPAYPPVAEHPVTLLVSRCHLATYQSYPVHLVYPVHRIALPVDTGVCSAQEMVYNGGFESGFNPVYVGHVGKGWGFFTNGGAANYG